MPRARQQRKTHSRKNGDTLQENVKFIICCNELESRSSEGIPYFDMPPGFFCVLSAGWVVKLLVQINDMMVVSMVYAQDTNQFQKFAKFYRIPNLKRKVVIFKVKIKLIFLLIT